MLDLRHHFGKIPITYFVAGRFLLETLGFCVLVHLTFCLAGPPLPAGQPGSPDGARSRALCVCVIVFINSLDCYWVGSLGFNFLVEINGLSTEPQESQKNAGGVNSNQDQRKPTQKESLAKELPHKEDKMDLLTCPKRIDLI